MKTKPKPRKRLPYSRHSGGGVRHSGLVTLCQDRVAPFVWRTRAGKRLNPARYMTALERRRAAKRRKQEMWFLKITTYRLWWEITTILEREQETQNDQ